MPSHAILQGPASIADNDTTWTDIPGLLSFTLTRSGPANPASLEAYITHDVVDQNIDGPPGTPPTQRWYPGLNLRLVLRDPTLFGVGPQGNVDFVLWIGRLDTATEEDANPTTPRSWRLMARDWLAVLADNTVGTGRWRDAAVQQGPPIPNCPVPLQRFVTFQPSAQYVPSYVNKYGGSTDPTKGPTLGEYRSNIIADLALNIVNTLDDRGETLGLFDVQFVFPPNSREINLAGSDLGTVPILQAIAELAVVDPWCFACCPGQCQNGRIDSLALDASNYPANGGIGGEFQISRYNDGCNNYAGRIAVYYARGAVLSGANFVYRTDASARGLVPTNQITQYSFSHEGMDIFSRLKPYGSGNTTDSSNSVPTLQGNPADGSQGVINYNMESVWAPTSGWFRIRREASQRTELLGGSSIYKHSTDATGQLQSRAINDQALAQLVVGATDQSNSAGMLAQGSITISGPPIAYQPQGIPGPPIFAPGIEELMVGYAAYVSIPDLGLASVPFTMDQIQYVWPDDYTRITLSRVGFSAVRRQLLALLGRAQDGQAGHTHIYTSAWMTAPHGGAITLRHDLGVQNVKVQVDAGYMTIIDGSHNTDPNGNPIPDPGTIVNVPPSNWFPGQGQNVGYTIISKDIDYLTLNVNKWLAPCAIPSSPGGPPGPPNQGQPPYLAADSPNTVIRITVTPS